MIFFITMMSIVIPVFLGLKIKEINDLFKIYKEYSQKVDRGEYKLHWRYNQSDLHNTITEHILQTEEDTSSYGWITPTFWAIVGMILVWGFVWGGVFLHTLSGFLGAFGFYKLVLLLPELLFRSPPEPYEAELYWGDNFVLHGSGVIYWDHPKFPTLRLSNLTFFKGEGHLLKFQTQIYERDRHFGYFSHESSYVFVPISHVEKAQKYVWEILKNEELDDECEEEFGEKEATLQKERDAKAAVHAVRDLREYDGESPREMFQKK
jgi:hypothetical protein